MSKGQAATMSLVAVGSMITGAFGLWNAWLTNNTFNDHATLTALVASVGDIKTTLDDKVVPALYPSERSGRSVTRSLVASSTQE